MNTRDLSTFTAADVANPDIDPAVLGRLAQARPDLRGAILVSTKCPPGLAVWIEQQMSAAPAFPQPTAHPPMTAGQWAALFRQANGREPTMSEFQAAVASGRILQDRRPHDPSMEQMAAGAKQLASGAKDFLSTRVAPAAAGAARSVQHAVNEQRGTRPSGLTGLTAWAPFALPVAAFLALVSLFLPAVSAFGMSVGFFDEEAGGEGAFLLILMLLVIGAAIAAIVVPKRWSRITAGVTGIVVGFFGAIDGFGTMAQVGDVRGASVGAGAVLLAVFSTVILVVAILTLLPRTATMAAPAPTPMR